MPAWRLLSEMAAAPEPVRVNWTLTAADRSGAVQEAAQARTAGFDTIKVKVAIGDDHGRLAAIRAFAGPDMSIRIDANGAWTPLEARAALRALEPVGIELCEEPVAGVAEIRELAADTEIPLALDESATDPAALPDPVCDLMCLKISRCGGLSGLLETARRARAAGYEVFLASTLDGPLGIAAALHAAAVLRPARASGLATLAMFSDREDPLPPTAGRIPVPAGRGLGDGLLDWYRPSH
jgi:L-alanine-DL-glutamate epimerase-like enolase superfamily enzyme